MLFRARFELPRLLRCSSMAVTIRELLVCGLEYPVFKLRRERSGSIAALDTVS